MSAVFVNAASQVLHLTQTKSDPLKLLTVRLSQAANAENRARAESRFNVTLRLNWGVAPWTDGVLLVDSRGYPVRWTYSQVGKWLARSLSGQESAVSVQIDNAASIPVKWSATRAQKLAEKIDAVNAGDVLDTATAKLAEVAMWVVSDRRDTLTLANQRLVAAAGTLLQAQGIQAGGAFGDVLPPPPPAPPPAPTPPPPPAPTPPAPPPPGGDTGEVGTFGPLAFDPGPRGGRYAALEGKEIYPVLGVFAGQNYAGDGYGDNWFLGFPVRFDTGTCILFNHGDVIREGTEQQVRDWAAAGMPVNGRQLLQSWERFAEVTPGEPFAAIVYDPAGQPVCALVDGVYVDVPTPEMFLYSVCTIEQGGAVSRMIGTRELGAGVDPFAASVRAALVYGSGFDVGQLVTVNEYTVGLDYDAELYRYRQPFADGLPEFQRGILAVPE